MELSSQMGKDIRLSKIFDPGGMPAILVKADQGLALGPVEGLEDLESGLKGIINAGVDGIVLGPGQVGREIHLFRGKEVPALLIRSDWSNVARKEPFPLPMKRMSHVSVAGAKHAAFLGASGILATFYVGYRDDEDEADNLEAVSALAAECFQFGLPLLVEAIPFGERITPHNYVDSVKMAGRMSLEAGADGIIVPYTGSKTTMAEVVESSGRAPVLLLMDEELDAKALRQSLKAGVRGVVLDDFVFRGDPAVTIAEIRHGMKGVKS